MIGKAVNWAMAALLAACGLGAAATPVAAAPCTQNCLAPGDYDLSMVWGGLTRTYKVHVPASYTGSAPVALALDIHGHALTADNQRTNSGQLQQSDQRGFIAVWPQGIGNSWNGNNCCTVAFNLNLDDVGFLRAVIGQIRARANINADKIYATGWSNGGGMSQRLACQAADLIRAAAPVAHPLNTNQCTPSRPITVIAFHGTADTVIPYDGGGNLPQQILGVPLGWQGARASLAAWKLISNCSSQLSQVQLTGASRDETYTACNGGVRAGLVTVAKGQHDLYHADPAADSIPVAEYIWTHVFQQ